MYILFQSLIKAPFSAKVASIYFSFSPALSLSVHEDSHLAAEVSLLVPSAALLPTISFLLDPQLFLVSTSFSISSPANFLWLNETSH